MVLKLRYRGEIDLVNKMMMKKSLGVFGGGMLKQVQHNDTSLVTVAIGFENTL
jgi:hypothetical protein